LEKINHLLLLNRVNCVAPGTIKTRMSEMLWKSESASDLVVSDTFLKRLGETQEIAGTVTYLLSDDASYVTGETIVAAGDFFYFTFLLFLKNLISIPEFLNNKRWHACKALK